MAGLNEVIRIPMIDYPVIFLLYGSYRFVSWRINSFKRPVQAGAGID
ncbi:MAG TPA: hypothetical protein VK880_03995 [Anaerolineales bacterium]|nr:hypothetical protein [Anaerolineales bacterium]